MLFIWWLHSLAFNSLSLRLSTRAAEKTPWAVRCHVTCTDRNDLFWANTLDNSGFGSAVDRRSKQMVNLYNRPFAGSTHIIRNKLHWDANDAVGLSLQRNSYQSSVTFLCFESPTASFASQCNLFRTMWLNPAKGLFWSILLILFNHHLRLSMAWEFV